MQFATRQYKPVEPVPVNAPARRCTKKSPDLHLPHKVRLGGEVDTLTRFWHTQFQKKHVATNSQLRHRDLQLHRFCGNCHPLLEGIFGKWAIHSVEGPNRPTSYRPHPVFRKAAASPMTNSIYNFSKETGQSGCAARDKRLFRYVCGITYQHPRNPDVVGFETTYADKIIIMSVAAKTRRLVKWRGNEWN